MNGGTFRVYMPRSLHHSLNQYFRPGKEERYAAEGYSRQSNIYISVNFCDQLFRLVQQKGERDACSGEECCNLKGRGCTFLRYPYVSQLLWSIILIRETEGGREEMSCEKEGLKTSISIMSVNSCLEFLKYVLRYLYLTHSLISVFDPERREICSGKEPLKGWYVRYSDFHISINSSDQFFGPRWNR